MPADINSFLSHFNQGGARANRYEVIISFPAFIGANSDAQQKISFTCKAASIPASTLGEAVAYYKGRQIKVPGDRTYDDWNITILIDNDFQGRDVFEKWSTGILGNHSNVVNSNNELNPIKIYGQAQVNQLDRNDNIIKRYQLTGLFPKVIGELTLGYDQNDAIMEQQITFSLMEWESYDSNNVQFTS